MRLRAWLGGGFRCRRHDPGGSVHQTGLPSYPGSALDIVVTVLYCSYMSTEAEALRYRALVSLRDSGWDGPIDQDGRPVYDLDAWIATHTQLMRPLR